MASMTSTQNAKTIADVGSLWRAWHSSKMHILLQFREMMLEDGLTIAEESPDRAPERPQPLAGSCSQSVM